jgi:hypothetical protein
MIWKNVCVLKAQSPACGAIGRWWTLQEVGPSGRKLGHWGHALEADIGSPAPSLSLLFCSLAVMRGAALLYQVPCHDVLFYYRPRSNTANHPRSETEDQINLSSF